MSKRSVNRDWIDLPAVFDEDPPGWPFEPDNSPELDMWRAIWRKPQAFMWARLGLGDQVAAYVRAYCESVVPDASSSLKGTVLRMETELGISVAGMHQNGWRILVDPPSDDEQGGPARQTATGNWLTGVTVEGP
jgi:hypothetical protein